MTCRERSGGSITVAAGGTACGFALITTVSPPNKNVVTSEMSHGKSQPLLRASRLRGVPTTWLSLLHQLSIHWLPKRSAMLPHRPGWLRRRIAIGLFKVTGSKPTDNKEYFRTFLCCVRFHLCSSDFNRALFRLVLPSFWYSVFQNWRESGFCNDRILTALVVCSLIIWEDDKFRWNWRAWGEVVLA